MKSNFSYFSHILLLTIAPLFKNYFTFHLFMNTLFHQDFKYNLKDILIHKHHITFYFDFYLTTLIIHDMIFIITN
jgi:hypothetical protein